MTIAGIWQHTTGKHLILRVTGLTGLLGTAQLMRPEKRALGLARSFPQLRVERFRL